MERGGWRVFDVRGAGFGEGEAGGGEGGEEGEDGVGEEEYAVKVLLSMNFMKRGWEVG